MGLRAKTFRWSSCRANCNTSSRTSWKPLFATHLRTLLSSKTRLEYVQLGKRGTESPAGQLRATDYGMVRLSSLNNQTDRIATEVMK